MKTCVSSYSFSKLYGKNFTFFDAVAKAKEMGFDAIEFAGLDCGEQSPVEYAKALAAEAKKRNIEIAALCVYADFLKENRAEAIARVKIMVDAAAAMGAGILRHDASGGDGRAFANVLPILADACREITEYAQKKNVRTAVENHGFFCQDSHRLEALYGAVAHPNFGLLTDVGNFLCADEDPAAAVGITAPFTFHAHVKDFHKKPGGGFDPGDGFFKSRNGNFLRGAVIGHGDVPVLHCLRALKRAGYDGYVTIEYEGIEDTLWAIRTGLENLKRMLILL